MRYGYGEGGMGWWSLWYSRNVEFVLRMAYYVFVLCVCIVCLHYSTLL
jgi:hypothetical protein